MTVAQTEPAASHRVLVVDDHPMMRDCIALALQAVIGQAHTTFAASVAEAEREVVRAGHYDYLILDLCLPDADGLSGVKRMRKACPDTRLVVFSGLIEREIVLQCIELGAFGFIPKSLYADEAVSAIRQIASGLVYIPRQLAGTEAQGRPHDWRGARRPDRAGGYPVLSDRQLDVLRLIARAYSRKEVCRKLGLSEGTVKCHLSAIYRALGVKGRTGAILEAQRLGITGLDS